MERRGTMTEDSPERILQAATLLFAEYGYHGVSTRAIAGAVGLNVATVSYHTGSKRDLYRRVFQRLFQREFDVVSAFAGWVDDDVVADPAALRALIERLIDALVDLTLQAPEVPRLWVRRWLEREFQFDDIEVDFSLPLYEIVPDLIERARAAGTIDPGGPDARLFLISFTWMLYGYFTGGPIPWNQAHADPLAPDQIAAFRTFLHDYCARMLDLPDTERDP
ncbi:MAG: TetR/AcrR family transcriptional regulator [Anaerolineae bacterium]|nr:TetR/AcrR family transcriptional regulator [Anaerolineae bacterium]